MPTGKKILKTTAIVISSVAGLYLLVLLIAGIYINTRKSSLITYATNELQENLRGHAAIKDLEISVWRHFPAISFTMTGFTLNDSVYNQPILSAQSVTTSINPFKLLSAKKTVNNIGIEHGIVHLFTDSTGYTNTYLLAFKKKNPDTVKKQDNITEIAIHAVSINDLALTIEDKSTDKEISLVVNNLDAAIDQQGQIIHVAMKENLAMKKGLGFNLRKGAYLEKQTLEADWKLEFNKTTKTLSYGQTEVKINGHSFLLNGQFCFDEKEPSFSVHVNVKGVPFNNAKAIVTAAIRQKLDLVSMKAPLDVHGVIEGSLLPAREPLVNISWETTANELTTPVAGFSNCSFTGNFRNNVNKDSAFGDPNSSITFYTFAGNWDGINLSGKNITITNLEHPLLRFDFHSDCLLETLDNKFALKDISLQNGNANLDLFYDGPITPDKSMLQDMEGRLVVQNGTIEYVPHHMAFTNCNGDIGFYKDSISMRKFTCNYKETKFALEVEGKNIRRKFVVNDLSQEAIIKCYVRSPFINLEDFKVLFGDKKQRDKAKKPQENFEATTRKLDALLENSVIGVSITAGNVKKQHLEAKNFNAYIKFAPRRWELAKVSLNLAGGSIVTKGKIIHAGNSMHNAVISTSIDHVDVQQLLYAFDNFGQEAVTHENLRGNFTTQATLQAGIGSDGKIIPSSINGSVNFSLKQGALQHFKPLENLKTFVFKDRDMTDVRFAEIKDQIDIKGNDIYLHRMEIESSVLRLFVEGNYGLNKKNTDLVIQVPFSNLSDKSFEGKAPENKGVKAKAGMGILLRAVNDDDGKIKVKLTLSKKIKKAKKEEPEKTTH